MRFPMSGYIGGQGYTLSPGGWTERLRSIAQPRGWKTRCQDLLQQLREQLERLTYATNRPPPVPEENR